MKRKVIVITGILILILVAVAGYLLSPYYAKHKIIAEINVLEKDFKNSTDRADRLELLKSTIQKSNDYHESEKVFSEISEQYTALISSMRNEFIKEYEQIMEENAPLDIGAVDDIDTLANHKDTLNTLLTTIESEKEYTLPNDSDYQTYVENLSSWTEAYASRISDIEEQQKAETEAQKEAREEAEKQAEEAANKMPEKENNTHYENEYFSVDVPDEWSGNWSVSEGPNYRENSNAVAVYEANVDISGGKGGAEIYVLEMKYPTDKLGYGNFSLPEGGTYVGETSNNKFVFIMSEAGYGFFSAGATITLK